MMSIEIVETLKGWSVKYWSEGLRCYDKFSFPVYEDAIDWIRANKGIFTKEDQALIDNQLQGDTMEFIDYCVECELEITVDSYNKAGHLCADCEKAQEGDWRDSPLGDYWQFAE